MHLTVLLKQSTHPAFCDHDAAHTLSRGAQKQGEIDNVREMDVSHIRRNKMRGFSMLMPEQKAVLYNELQLSI